MCCVFECDSKIFNTDPLRHEDVTSATPFHCWSESDKEHARNATEGEKWEFLLNISVCFKPNL